MELLERGTYVISPSRFIGSGSSKLVGDTELVVV